MKYSSVSIPLSDTYYENISQFSLWNPIFVGLMKASSRDSLAYSLFWPCLDQQYVTQTLPQSVLRGYISRPGWNKSFVPTTTLKT